MKALLPYRSCLPSHRRFCPRFLAGPVAELHAIKIVDGSITGGPRVIENVSVVPDEHLSRRGDRIASGRTKRKGTTERFIFIYIRGTFITASADSSPKLFSFTAIRFNRLPSDRPPFLPGRFLSRKQDNFIRTSPRQ